MPLNRTTASPGSSATPMERRRITPRPASRRELTQRRRTRVALEQLESRLCLSGGTLTTDSSSPTPISLPAFQAGSILSITATLSTTDADENGEGEPLVVQCSGGFSFTISDYSAPHAFQYRATQNNEQISAFISGADGDERANITVEINSNSKQRYTDEQKARFNKAAAEINIAAAGLAVIAAGLAFVPSPDPVTKGLALGFGVGSGVYWLESAIFSRLALDPSDPNFTIFAQPSNLPFTPLTAQSGLPQAAVDAVNALDSNEVQIISSGEAVLTTIDRAQGAFDAGNRTFENLQLQHLQQVDQHLATLISADAGLRSNFTAVLAAAGVNQAIQSGDVKSFEDNVARDGLPDFVTSELKQLGATSAEIAQIRQAAIVQDTSKVAGNWPAMLSNSTLLADLQALAHDLLQPVVSGEFSQSSITGLTGPRAATSVSNLTVVGTAPAGTSIQLFAQASGQSAVVMVGQTVVDSGGQWSITSSKLANGTYVCSMNVVSSDGSVLPAPIGTVVIDTTSPEVSSVTYNRATGQVTITLQDPGSGGFDLSSLTNIANYTVHAGKSPKSKSLPFSGFTFSAGPSGTEMVTFNLVKSKKVKHLPRSFNLTILSRGVRNAAGTPLDGEFKATLPSGDGQAGGDFIALVPLKIKPAHHKMGGHKTGGKKK